MINLIEEIREKIKNRHGKLSDRCFVLGNGPSLRDIDLELLKDEVTICCNSFMEGMAEKDKVYVPTIICGGDGSMLRDQIRENFQYDSKGSYSKTKSEIIYIYHPGALIRNCYDIKNWKTLCPHTDTNKTTVVGCACPYTKPVDIDVLENIMQDSGNMYMIEDFTSFKLNKSIVDLIGTEEKANQIFTNYTYCYKYSNVIPMISLLIAKEVGFKYIYLIGCDGNRFDVHFYDKFTGRSSIDTQTEAFKNRYYGGVYKGMLERKNELDTLNIQMTSCFETAYDFILWFSINEFVKKNGKDNVIEKYHNYVVDSIERCDINYIQPIRENIVKLYNYSESVVVIGDLVNVDEIDLSCFNQCPIIVSNRVVDKFIKKHPNMSPAVVYSDDPDTINTSIDNWFNNTQFKNLENTVIIFNILQLFFKVYNLEDNTYIDKDRYDKIQQFIDNNKNVFIVNSVDNMKLVKSIGTLSNKTVVKENLANNIKYGSIKSILGIHVALKLGFRKVFLLGCNINLTLDIKKVTDSEVYFCNLQTKHSTSTNSNTNIEDVNFDKLLIEKRHDVLKSLVSYANISQIKYSPEMALIVDALEAIMTGKNDSVLHDYIYMKQRIVTSISAELKKENNIL